MHDELKSDILLYLIFLASFDFSLFFSSFLFRKSAKDKIIFESPEARLTLIKMDLASYESVRAAAVELRKKVDSIDILLLNAGAFTTEFVMIENVNALQEKFKILIFKSAPLKRRMEFYAKT